LDDLPVVWGKLDGLEARSISASAVATDDVLEISGGVGGEERKL
jgi:hypothetical protein